MHTWRGQLQVSTVVQASDPRQGLIQAQQCLHKPWLHSVPLRMCIVVEANGGVRSVAHKCRAGRASPEYVHGGGVFDLVLALT